MGRRDEHFRVKKSFFGQATKLGGRSLFLSAAMVRMSEKAIELQSPKKIKMMDRPLFWGEGRRLSP